MSDDVRRIEQRLARAEMTLRILAEGQFPRLNKFIFGGSSEFRGITDRLPFNEQTPPSTVNEDEWIASESSFIVRCSHEDGSPRVTVYYERKLSDAEALLAAKAYHALLTATYTAIGLDMNPPEQAVSHVSKK